MRKEVWRPVTQKGTGTKMFARVSREMWYSDDGYSRWSTPVEYEVCPSEVLGLDLLPDETQTRAIHAKDFTQQFKFVKQERR